MESLTLTIQTPKKRVFENTVDFVHVRTEEGETEIYPGHTSFMATIGFSNVSVKQGDHQETFLLQQGLIFTDPKDNHVRILAYQADKTSEMDRQSAQEYLNTILNALEKREDLNKYQVKFLEEQMVVVESLVENTTEKNS